jgi:hypothetical protein
MTGSSLLPLVLLAEQLELATVLGRVSAGEWAWLRQSSEQKGEPLVLFSQ